MVSDVEGAGDVWTWTAIDADSKMIISYFVGDRDAQAAYTFMCDVKCRLNNRVQLTTDGHKAYLNAVPDAFGSKIDMLCLSRYTVSQRVLIKQSVNIAQGIAQDLKRNVL